MVFNATFKAFSVLLLSIQDSTTVPVNKHTVKFTFNLKGYGVWLHFQQYFSYFRDGQLIICAISAYHHQSCEFESRSWRDILSWYVTLWDKVCQWLPAG
jgi:hypothetical protein